MILRAEVCAVMGERTVPSCEYGRAGTVWHLAANERCRGGWGAISECAMGEGSGCAPSMMRAGAKVMSMRLERFSNN